MEKIYINYSLFNKGEIFSVTKNLGDLRPLYVQPYGICYCSLLNSVNEFEKFVIKFKQTHFDKTEVHKVFINNIIKRLIKISPYLEVLSIELKNATSIEKIHHILEYSVMILKKADTFYYELKNGIQSFGLPAMSIQSNNGLEYYKNYAIKNIRELLQVNAYILFHNKFHLKRCRYCNKYFVTTKGQSRFCNNPSPINPSKTCKEIPKRIYNSTDETIIDESDLSKAIYSLEPQYCRIKTNFYDSCKREINIAKKDLITQNRQKFMNCVRQLKKEIKGSNKSKSKKIIKIYSDFLDTVEQNLKLKPKQFNIDKPTYTIK